MKKSKLISSLITGAALAAAAGILIYRNSKNCKKNNVNADLEAEFTNQLRHAKAGAKSHFRKTMDKANHIKQEHKTSYL